MARPRARWLPLSLPRRLVAEALRACRGVPTVTAERRMDLGELAEARRAWATRPAWSAIHARIVEALDALYPDRLTSRSSAWLTMPSGARCGRRWSRTSGRPAPRRSPTRPTGKR